MMSDSTIAAVISNLSLIIVPILLLPTAILALFYNYAALILIPQNTLRWHVRRSTRFHPRTILITGISTPAGLRLARAFYQTGHKIVGVDQSRWSPARLSKAVARYLVIRSAVDYDQSHKYIEKLLGAIVKEKADLWIDCSERSTTFVHAQARRVIEQKTNCACLAADVDLIDKFRSRDAFLDSVKSLGLSTLETHHVRSRNDIHSILNDSRGKKYLLSTQNGSTTPPKRAILPRRTLSQTYHDVSQLKITSKEPWVLEQYVEDLPRYTAFALIVNGSVKAYTVCCKTKTDGSLQMVPSTSGLNQSMRQYIKDLIQQTDVHMTAPLSIDFYVGEKPTKSGVSQQILPVDGRLATSVALVQFAGRKGSIDLTRSYMSLIASTANGLGSYTGLPFDDSGMGVAEPTLTEVGLYSLGEDLGTVLTTFSRVLVRRAKLTQFFETLVTVTGHAVSWREETYEFWDPLPSFWLYLVCGPLWACLDLGRLCIHSFMRGHNKPVMMN